MYRVFLIDDEPWALVSLERLVDWNSLGFEIARKIENARAAWEFIERERPDVVFTDIRMPGMSGLDLLGRIRDSSMSIEVVLFSAFADFSYAQEAIGKGAFEYLLKPVKREILDACVRKLAKKLDGNAQARARGILSSRQNIRDIFLALTGEHPEDDVQMCVVICSDETDRIVSTLVRAVCRSYRVEMEQGQTVYVCACRPVGPGATVARISSAWPLNPMGGNDGEDVLFQRLEQTCVENGIIGGFGMVCSRGGRMISAPTDAFGNMYRYARDAMLTAGFIRRAGLLAYMQRMRDVSSSVLYKAVQYNQKTMIAEGLDDLRGQVSAGRVTLDQLFSMLHSIERIYTQEQKMGRFLPETWNDYVDILNDYPHIDDLFDYLHTVLVGDTEDVSRSSAFAIKAVLNEIDLHYANVQTLDSLSQTLGSSPASLSLLVKKHTGKTYSELIQAKRMEHARDLLAYSDVTIAAISEMVGYSDQFYFTKLFKKIFGISPNAYRKQVRSVK